MPISGETRFRDAWRDRNLPGAGGGAESPREQIRKVRTVRTAVQYHAVGKCKPLPEVRDERSLVHRKRASPRILSRQRQRRRAALGAAAGYRHRIEIDIRNVGSKIGVHRLVCRRRRHHRITVEHGIRQIRSRRDQRRGAGRRVKPVVHGIPHPRNAEFHGRPEISDTDAGVRYNAGVECHGGRRFRSACIALSQIQRNFRNVFMSRRSGLRIRFTGGGHRYRPLGRRQRGIQYDHHPFR